MALCLAGCNPTATNSNPWKREYRILAFATLGDTAIAVQVTTGERKESFNGIAHRNQVTSIAVFDRSLSRIRKAGTLPPEIAAILPEGFVACEGGVPVSRSTGTLKGPAGACSDSAGGVSGPGGIFAFPGADDSLHIFDSGFKRVAAWSSAGGHPRILEINQDSGIVSTLESAGADTSLHLWRRHHYAAPIAAESAWVKSPVLVHVSGAGTRLACLDPDIESRSPACWAPDNLVGTSAPFYSTRGDAISEWNPAKKLLVYLDLYGTRFNFLYPETSQSQTVPIDSLLLSYRP